MISTWFKDIFREFYHLYFSCYPKEYNPGFKDTPIESSTFLRRNSLGYTIYYLYSGMSVFIPKEWVVLFTSFNEHSGDRVYRIPIDYCEDSIDVIGYSMLLLIESLNPSFSSISSESVNSSLGNVYRLGTQEFISWTREEFNLSLSSLELKSVSEDITFL